MVEGVAHDMDQGIDELLDDQLVELGVAARELESDLLAEIDAEASAPMRAVRGSAARRVTMAPTALR
jgi:hypothetical protein